MTYTDYRKHVFTPEELQIAIAMHGVVVVGLIEFSETTGLDSDKNYISWIGGWQLEYITDGNGGGMLTSHIIGHLLTHALGHGYKEQLVEYVPVCKIIYLSNNISLQMGHKNHVDGGTLYTDYVDVPYNHIDFKEMVVKYIIDMYLGEYFKKWIVNNKLYMKSVGFQRREQKRYK